MILKSKTAKTLSICLSILTFLSACSTKLDNIPVNEDTPSQIEQQSDENQEPEKETSQNSNDEESEVNLKDDFYAAINSKWLSENEIPANKVAIGGFNDLIYEVEDKLIADVNKMLDEGKDNQDDELGNMLRLYKMALDFKTLDQDGAKPIQSTLEKINAINSYDDLNKSMVEFTYLGVYSPLLFSVSTDMKDTKKNTIYVSQPQLTLGEKSFYEDGNPTGEFLIPIYEQMITEIMILAGENEENAKQIAADTIEFEKIIAQYSKSSQELSDYTKSYNPKTPADMAQYSKTFDFISFVSALTGQQPNEYIVANPDFAENIDIIFSQDNFSKAKSWMKSTYVTAATYYLSDDFRLAIEKLNSAMNGTTELDPREKSAYRVSTGSFGHVRGNYYGETYFGAEAKKDVLNMINNMINVYKTKIQNNDWLSEDTKAQAVNKLELLSIKIGYPDELDEIYKQYKVIPYEEGGSLFGNVMNFNEITIKRNYEQLDKPVDREKWNITGDTVNAFYNPSNNEIVFPAAFLQSPFYDINQSASANYGAIGAVIAHEISHAFDPNGSKFDGYGNLNNWWSEQDYKKFEDKSNAMVELFSSIEFLGSQVNGQLTMSENVADAGGLSCALEAAKGLEDINLNEFFESWATIWRSKETPEYGQLLLTMDNHAPNKLRTNVQLSMLDDFYTTYDITENDKMYIAPENRINIW